MKRRVIASVIVILAAVALVPSANAQDAWIELLRSDFQADKVAILTAAMQLTDEEAKVFWPIYREYGVELNLVHDRRIELIKAYASKFMELSDDAAGELLDEWFGIQQDLLKLKKKYYKRVQKALDTGIAARFIHVERQIELVIDLQIQSEMPLIRATKTKP